jgi:hypothetical protein
MVYSSEDFICELKDIVNHQAFMESLWALEPTINEAMLQAALRHIHAVIEGNEEMAEKAKNIYWNLESEM